MRDRKYRRNQRKRIIEKCKKMLNNSHFQGGTLYEKHVNKIEEKGFGYMAKHGTKTHYIQGNNQNVNVRDRESYNGTNNWDVKDIRQFDSLNSSEQDFFDNQEG